MKKVFVDTSYLIAIANPRNQQHQSARQARSKSDDVQFVKTDEVLSEFLTAISKHSPILRQAAARIIDPVLSDSQFKVFDQSRELFMFGSQLFRERKDKDLQSAGLHIHERNKA